MYLCYILHYITLSSLFIWKSCVLSILSITKKCRLATCTLPRDVTCSSTTWKVAPFQTIDLIVIVTCCSHSLFCSPSRTRWRAKERTVPWSWTASASSSMPRIAPTASVRAPSSATSITMLCIHAGTRLGTWCWWVTCRTTSSTLTHLCRYSRRINTRHEHWRCLMNWKC